MIALAASAKPPGAPRRPGPASRAANFAASSGSPITPVEARNTSAGLQPAALAASFAVNSSPRGPILPVKALALPELTTSARALPPLEPVAAPIDRRRRTFRAREYAGDRRAGIEQRQQHVGAVRVSDARRARSRAARRRSRGISGTCFGRQRRNGGRPWREPGAVRPRA